METLPTLLIVDDNDTNLKYLEIILKDVKVNLIKANSGFEALKKIKGHKISLAIIDIIMPNMSGLELAVKINADRTGKEIPIIFLTALEASEKQMVEGYKCGAIDYILKPITKQVLLSKINVFINLFSYQAALRESEERWQFALEGADDGVWDWNIQTNYVFFSPQWKSILGYDKHELGNTVESWDNLVHPEDKQKAHKILKNHLKGETPVYINEYRLLCKNGVYKWIEARGKVIARNTHGKPLRAIVTHKDISEHKRVEEELIRSEEIHRTLFHSSPDAIVILNLKGIITDISEMSLELYGTTNKYDLLGKHYFRFVLPDSEDRIKQIMERTISEGLVQNEEILMATKKKNLSGTEYKTENIECEISTTLIQDKKGVPVSIMATIRDISNRKKLLKQKIHTERMVALGEMASGIAHEINQPLNNMSLTLDSIIFESSKSKSISKAYLDRKTEKIFDSIFRIKNIIEHFQSFSRHYKKDYVHSSFNINESIKNALSLVSEQIKHRDIKLKVRLDKNIPSIMGNTYKFEQVILNLIANAKDALEEKTDRLQKDFPMFIDINTFQENHCVILEVKDNGSGIKSDEIDDVMLPFFTTKEEGKGSGMGLSISFEIIKELGGTIVIKSELLKGTTVSITIPIEEEITTEYL